VTDIFIDTVDLVSCFSYYRFMLRRCISYMISIAIRKKTSQRGNINISDEIPACL
jgi:hypothetical protein